MTPETNNMLMREMLKEMGVVNTHDLLARFATRRVNDVAVSYVPGRSVFSPRAQVWSPSHKTDLKADWYDYQNKTFLGEIKVAMAQAMKWASERYGIKEWAVCPTDRATRIPAEVRERVLAALAQKKSGSHRGDHRSNPD